MRWKRILVTLFVVAMLCPAGASAGGRTLQGSIQRNGAETLSLDTAVGDVTITTSDGETIVARVVLTPRKTGIFSSMKKSKRQVASATLEMQHDGKTISVRLAGFSGDPRFEATWHLTIPVDLGLELDMGVGDLDVQGTAGPVDADIGVGDATVRSNGGNLSIDVGVGDIEVHAPATAYGTVECSSGVGEITLREGQRHMEGRGMIARDLTWKGPGSGTMDLETGVGDVDVTFADSPGKTAASPSSLKRPGMPQSSGRSSSSSSSVG